MTVLKIVFIQRQFSHYRKSFFDELNKHYKIILLYGGVDSTIKEEVADYAIKVKYFKYWKKVTNVFLNVFGELLKLKPEIVVHEANPSIISLPLVQIFCRFMNIKFVLWGHGYNRTNDTNPHTNVKTRIRLLLMRKADAVIFYDHKTRDLFKNYLGEEKLFVAQNTLDTNKLLKIREGFEAINKLSLRNESKIIADYNLVFIGRLIPEKIPVGSVKILQMIKKKLPNHSINLHIIGDGPELNNLKLYILENELSLEIRLYGAMYDDYEIGKILYLSDLLINPGSVGLNVINAYCFNLPIFTFKKGMNGPFHGPEVEVIVDGQTGFLSKPFNYNEMAKKIVQYLNSPQMQRNVRIKIQQIAEHEITIETMVKGFQNCFNYILNK